MATKMGVKSRRDTIRFVDRVEEHLAENLRIIELLGVVNEGMAYELSKRLRYMASVSKKPITIYLNTPGGHIMDGLAIYDLIKSATAKVPVNIVCTGACMSMGTIILQAATKRLSTPNTQFMLHELSMETGGSLGALRDQQAHAERLQKMLNGILSDRTGHDIKKLTKMFGRKDYFIDAQEAQKINLIDEIIA